MQIQPERASGSLNIPQLSLGNWIAGVDEYHNDGRRRDQVVR